MTNKNEKSTRREFMKSSTVSAVGVGVLGHLAMAPRAFADSDETIRVGLVGCGGRGTGAVTQALSTEGPVELVAMGDAFSDRLEDSLKGVRGNLGERAEERIKVDSDHKFIGFDAYQKVLESDIDLIILATPPGFRPIHFEAAVKAGKHIFMEKPVSTDATGVRRVLAAVEEAKKKNLKVGVGLQRHHQPHYHEAIDRIRDGAIGDLVALRVYWNGAGVWVRPRVPGQTEMEYQMRNWYYFNWLCGDHIVEQHIHNLDVGNWLVDDFPVKAWGMGGRQVRTGKDYGEIFDHFACRFEFKNGVQMFSEARHIANCWSSVSEHAHGSKGTLDISDRGGTLTAGDNKWRLRHGADPYQVEHDDLFAAIRQDLPYNEGHYGAMSTMTAILGRMATYCGKELTMEDALNSKMSIMPETFAWDAAPPTLPDADGNYRIPVPGVSEVV